MYLIWSFTHGQWWYSDRCGYTDDIEQAGRYNAREAGEIATQSIMCDSIAVHEQLARIDGPPKFHPYRGSQRSKDTNDE